MERASRLISIAPAKPAFQAGSMLVLTSFESQVLYDKTNSRGRSTFSLKFYGPVCTGFKQHYIQEAFPFQRVPSIHTYRQTSDTTSYECSTFPSQRPITLIYKGPPTVIASTVGLAVERRPDWFSPLGLTSS